MFLKSRLKKALLVAFSLLFACSACLFAACGGKPEEKIELLAENERPVAYVFREFDAMSIVSDTNGYELVITECYYLDDDLEMVEIETNGTKFTPTVLKEVYLTLKTCEKPSRRLSESLIERKKLTCSSS